MANIDDSILRRIEKCMRLSKSAEPHEAAAALRQAQKLMAMHGISDADLAGASYGCEAVETPIPARRALPIFMDTLISLITRAFGVRVVIEKYWPEGQKKPRQMYRMRYWGPQDRVKLAMYAHAVVFRACNASWSRAVKEDPEIAKRKNARMNFRLAWLEAVTSTVDALGMRPEERQATEMVQAKHYGTSLSTAKVNTSGRYQDDMRQRGKKAAEGFSLHRPMNGAEQLKIGKGN